MSLRHQSEPTAVAGKPWAPLQHGGDREDAWGSVAMLVAKEAPG